VTDQFQSLAEKCYWVEVEREGPGLIHDKEGESFHTQSGELALSWDFVHLERLMGTARMEAWEEETG
jgi:hypothetical protein